MRESRPNLLPGGSEHIWRMLRHIVESEKSLWVVSPDGFGMCASTRCHRQTRCGQLYSCAVRVRVCCPVGIMALSSQAVLDVIAALPPSRFGGAHESAVAKWVLYVAGVDSSAKHSALHYAVVARIMAEGQGTMNPSDYSDPVMRDLLLADVRVRRFVAGAWFMRLRAQERLKAKATPFTGEDEPAEWKAVVVLGAHVMLALRVQQMAADAMARHRGASSAQGCAVKTVGDLSESVQNFVKVGTPPRCAPYGQSDWCSARLTRRISMRKRRTNCCSCSRWASARAVWCSRPRSRPCAPAGAGEGDGARVLSQEGAFERGFAHQVGEGSEGSVQCLCVLAGVQAMIDRQEARKKGRT